MSGLVGYSLPEYSFIGYLTNDYIRSFSINITKETNGKTPWEVLYKFPEYGVSMYCTTLGNNAVFGKAIALNYFFKLKYINRERFNFYNRIGIGGGYLTQKFDVTNNNMNLAIGSHFNVHFVFKLGVYYQVTPRLGANLGLSFDHFSNGNARDPNRGLNLFTSELGIDLLLGKQLERSHPTFESFTKSNNLTIFASVGTKHPRSFENKRYNTASFALSLNREVAQAFHLGIGLDLFYDSYISTNYANQGKEFHAYDAFQTGLNFSQQFVYNRFRIIIQEGVYLGLTNKLIKKSIYNRAIVQYAVTPKLNIRIAMKSHLQILDYPELGIGIKI